MDFKTLGFLISTKISLLGFQPILCGLDDKYKWGGFLHVIVISYAEAVSW